MNNPECELGAPPDGFAVSVIIPVYNAARFLAQAVESALQQPEVGEVLLVDDGSTDDSAAVAETLADRNPGRVKRFKHEGSVNQGPGASRNLGLQRAACPFVAFLDADDWYLPGCFAFDRQAFAADPALVMVRHSLGNGWDPEDETQQWFVGYTGTHRARARFHSRVPKGVSPSEYFQSLYPLGDVGSGVAGVLTVRKEHAIGVGGFPCRDWAEDATFHLKLAAVGKVAFADRGQPMAMRRIHAGNLSRRLADERAYRVDAMGHALLDLADFARARKCSRTHQTAIHIGWLRFARLYQTLNPYALLHKSPWALLSPWTACAYARLTAYLGLRSLRRRMKAVLSGFKGSGA